VQLNAILQTRTQPHPAPQVVGDEDSYAVSPRAPLLTTDLQNNAFLCGARRAALGQSQIQPTALLYAASQCISTLDKSELMMLALSGMAHVVMGAALLVLLPLVTSNAMS
jgi:hypothetical protein